MSCCCFLGLRIFPPSLISLACPHTPVGWCLDYFSAVGVYQRAVRWDLFRLHREDHEDLLRRIQVRHFVDDCLSGWGMICGGLSKLG